MFQIFFFFLFSLCFVPSVLSLFLIVQIDEINNVCNNFQNLSKFQESWEDEDEDEKKDEEKVNVTPVKSKPKMSLQQKIAEKEVSF